MRKSPEEFLEKIPGGVFGGNPQMNSMKKSPEEFLEKISGAILWKNLRRISGHFWGKSPRRYPRKHFWRKPSEQFLEKISG